SNTYNLTQYLFTPAEFSPAVPATGGTITRVYIRAGNSQSAGSTFNLAMNMGATPAATLSSASWTLGLSTIYSNATASVGAWNAGDWIPVTLQTPFVWNGSSNFVIGVYQGSFTNPLAVQLGAVSGRNGRAFGNGNNAAPSGADDKLISFGFDLACTGAPSTPTITTAAFPATAPLCSGATTTIQASFPDSPVPDGISYQWESSSSATGPCANVSGGSGATTLSYTTGALTASTYFRLAVHCSYSSTSSYSSAFLAPVGPAQPAAISGPVAFCPGDAATYSVPNISGTTYTWTLPSGWSGSSTGNSITVTPGAAAGAISVSASPACAGSTAPSLRS